MDSKYMPLLVRQVMTPRTVTFYLNENITVSEAMEKITQLSSHSRVPIYNDEIDNIEDLN